MIPKSLSAEHGEDSEPNLAVNPANPLHLAASAFTPDPAGSGSVAPIYVSTDGGLTWSLNDILPTGQALTNDITLRFGSLSNVLYAAFIAGPSLFCRTADFKNSDLMTVLVREEGLWDQPWVEATTAETTKGTPDRVYVGFNDRSKTMPVTPYQTASIDFSLDAATAPPPDGFSGPIIISSRVQGYNSLFGLGENAPSIRCAIHQDGTVYVAYFDWLIWNSSGSIVQADVVVRRDDNWGQGSMPFTRLVDPSDNRLGRIVMNVPIVWNWTFSFGGQRTGSQLSIAVDPNNSRSVYVAWLDNDQSLTYPTIHLRHSSDGGATWSNTDIRTIPSATNPAIAVNVHGAVGLLYELLTATGWETRIEISADGFSTVPTAFILAKMPANAGWFGDYIYLAAVGKDFWGVFTSDNTPDMANFPNGVVYQRNANFTTHELLAVDNKTVVPNSSIDPFFFKVTTIELDQDFYVRDWTDTPTSGDTGLEPSNHPVFWATSDVWNRNSDDPGAMNSNGQPENQDAASGTGTKGDNWAFARIRRNAPGSQQTVTAHFLVSEFGTGSNFQDNLSGSNDIIFVPTDPTVTFSASETGPKTTSGYPWNLKPSASTHLCLAVQISTTNDPYMPPSLSGSAPGWPTDLRILNDNNKAQRNLGVTVVNIIGRGHHIPYSAVVHNAAPFTRDMELLMSGTDENVRRLQGATITINGEQTVAFQVGKTITVPNMLPGENRIVTVSMPCPVGTEGETLYLDFHEVIFGNTISGFSIGVQFASVSEVLRNALKFQNAVFQRVGALFQNELARIIAAEAEALAYAECIEEAVYLNYVVCRAIDIECIAIQIPPVLIADMFDVAIAFRNFRENATAPAAAVPLALDHLAALDKLNASMTIAELAKGSVADILQNVRWQDALYSNVFQLRSLPCSAQLRSVSKSYISNYSKGLAGGADYPSLIAGLMPCFVETAQALPSEAQALNAAITAMRTTQPGNLTGLQKAHRDFLLVLEGLQL